MNERLSTLLAEVGAVFETPQALAQGVTFEPHLCSIWSAALRDMVRDVRALEDAFARLTHERDQLLAIARDADLVAFARAGAPKPVRSGNIIDISAILLREHPVGQAGEGGAA